MPINIFDRTIFGDLNQFDTTQTVPITIIEPNTSVSDSVIRGLFTTIKIIFNSIIVETLSFISRIKPIEDVSI